MIDVSCLTPTLIRNPDRVDTERFITVPCGKCPSCRKRRAAQWSFRLLQEHLDSIVGASHFITLTYDEDHVAITRNGNLSLFLPDWQLFWKRLRERNGRAIPVRYYGCGEYGSASGRPHWHAIAYNILKVDHIHDSWNYGSVKLGDVNIRSVSYVTGYIMKPPPNMELEQSGDIERTRPFMSKGLGARYLRSEAIRRYHNERLEESYLTQLGGRKIAMPRYYKERLYEKEALQKLRISLKRASKKRAREMVEEFIRRFPDKDYDDFKHFYVGQELRYDKNNQKSKRNGV